MRVSSPTALMRTPRLRVFRPPPPLLGLCLVTAKLRHLRERAPRPARQLAIPQLFGHPDRVPQVFLGLVEAAELALGDSAGGTRVGQLPPCPRLGKDRHTAIDPGQRLLAASEIV